MMIPFGILSAAGVSDEAGTYELIETSIVSGSSTSTITFSSLNTYSSTYKHLQIRIAARSSHAVTQQVVDLRFNGDSGSNYALHRLTGNGSAVSSAGATSQGGAYAALIPGSSATANAFGASVCDILDTFSSTKNKTTRAMAGQPAGNEISMYSGAWFNTASITSIAASIAAGTFIAGSRFSLYGIKG
jgi:hypothetical protein